MKKFLHRVVYLLFKGENFAKFSPEKYDFNLYKTKFPYKT